MVNVMIGDLFKSDAQTLVNTVNCVGVMGKGVALGFKERFPAMFKEYAARCRRGQVRLGRPYLFRGLERPWILNFPTKDHWRSVAKLEDISNGLRYLIDHYEEWGITSLAVPPLGCGEGQLEWSVVGPTLYRYLTQLHIPAELYAPFGTPPTQLELDFLSRAPEAALLRSGQGRIKPDWIALVEILDRIEREEYHWPIGRTMFQKIAYFATDAGVETDLEFSRGSYGPMASDLKRKVTQLTNNGLIQERQLGRMFNVRVGPTYPDARRAHESSIRSYESIIENVADLFLRLDTGQAEIAATVHFVARELVDTLSRTPSECEVLDEVLEWKQRRRPPLDEAAIAQTIRNLAMLGWIHVSASTTLPVSEDALTEA